MPSPSGSSAICLASTVVPLTPVVVLSSGDVGGDLHRLLDAAGRQGEGELQDVADADVVAGADDGLEAGELGLDGIGAGVQIEDLEQPLVVGDDGLRDGGGGVGDGDGDARQDAAGGVDDGAADASAEVLGSSGGPREPGERDEHGETNTGHADIPPEKTPAGRPQVDSPLSTVTMNRKTQHRIWCQVVCMDGIIRGA